MAEVALTSIAKSALQLFSSLAKDESLLLWNSKKELQRLQRTIETIDCLLQDVDKLQSKTESVRSCLARLRGVMYDAEDFFDTLAYHALRKKAMDRCGAIATFSKEVRLFFSKSNQLGLIVRTAHEVKSLRECLDGMKADMEFCGFQLMAHPLLVAQPMIRFGREKTHSFVHGEDVVGRDQEREDIVNLLLPKGETSDGGRSFSVVAVIGFGGLGKTTLAQLVYNDERVKQGFEVRLWACVNYLSNLEQVLVEIIASEERRHVDLGLEKLQEKLRSIIGGKKYLVVLDDVWDEDSRNWISLETILRCGRIGSKVVVTTRSQRVAECVDASKPCCVDLKGLSDESAWSLFVRKAFLDGELNKHPDLEALGKKIVSRCWNVPLAIIIVGSLLRRREKEERVWSHFFENELGKALSNKDGDRIPKSIKDVLMVSYHDLLPSLKLCFAYCSLFPKDYEFDKDELVCLWVAQGFIRPCFDSKQSLEELGEECFFHLAERCFFQEVEEFYFVDKFPRSSFKGTHLYGYTAKMHDLLHDVAIDIARSESIRLDKDPIEKGKRESLRHISVDSRVGDVVDCLVGIDPKSIRSLRFYPTLIRESSLNISVLVSCRMLRTLDLQGQGIIDIPDSIGELIHLRYLNLSDNAKLKHLPRSICKLHHLMTLVLQGCTILEKLPSEIGKLVSLRQLYIGGCNGLDCMPPGLTALTSLVHLDRLIVHPDSGGLGYLNCLDNLHGVLRIELPKGGWSDAVVDAKRSNMLKKNKLDGLIIDWKENCPHQMAKADAKAVLDALEPHSSRIEHLEITGYNGEKLPSWLCKLENVKKLDLRKCENVEYIEDEMKGNLPLPSLKSLELSYMKDLKGWWRQEEQHEENQRRRPCLPKLSYVNLVDCPKLKGGMPLVEGIDCLDLYLVDVKLVNDMLSPKCSSDDQSSSIAPCDNGSKLKEIFLFDIKGLIWVPEGWIRKLTALQRLSIRFCSDMQQVSRRGLSHLTALKELSLDDDICEIGDDDGEKEVHQAGMPWKALRELETLKLAVGDKDLEEGLQYLTSLKFLKINKWKHQQLENGDILMGFKLPSNANVLQNLGELDISFGRGTDYICHLPNSGIPYLHSLKTLKIHHCKELYLGWKTLLLIIKLESLELSHVRSLVDVDEKVEQPTHLRGLIIADMNFQEAKWLHDMIPWKFLTSLDKLTLVGISGMEQLPDGIQHLTSISFLYVKNCFDFRSIPSWFPQLTSLTALYIHNAKVTSRCRRECEDWPLISHIPHIDLFPE